MYLYFLGCSSGVCSHNWIGYTNSYYHFSSEVKTWAESQSACAEMNSHLLKVNSEDDLVGHILPPLHYVLFDLEVLVTNIIIQQA